MKNIGYSVFDAVSHSLCTGNPSVDLIDLAREGPVFAALHHDGVWRPVSPAAAAYMKLMGDIVEKVYVAESRWREGTLSPKDDVAEDVKEDFRSDDERKYEEEEMAARDEGGLDL